MATSLAALLGTVAGGALRSRVLPDSPRPVTRVTLAEDLTSTDALLPGALCVFTRASAEAAGGYQLDVLVRRAAERDVAGVVLRRSTRRSMTAEQLALRGQIALLDVGDEVDPAILVDHLGAAVAGDARESLLRLAQLARWRPSDPGGVDAIVEEMSRASGIELAYDPTDDAGVPVDVDGRVRGSVTTVDPGDAATVASRIAAGVLSEALTKQAREDLTPVRSASVALAQLLLASQANLPLVSARATALGLPVHGWHCAARLVLDPATSGEGTESRSGPDELEDAVLELLAQRQGEARGSWSAARPDDTTVIVHSTRSDPRRDAVTSLRTTLDGVVTRLIGRYPNVRARVGIGTPHDGASGLRVSAEEARTALAAARLSDDSVSVATFDSLGLQRMLAEWLVTDTARDTVSDLLAPLDALGQEKSAVAVQTLHAYLDERGSLQRAAARLHLHRNAVVYRMTHIRRVLQVDLDDPDERFAVQLACRARLMTAG
jgi:hypothetical protein